MPELPEVETVVRQLNETIPQKSTLIDVKTWRKDLRFVMPKSKMKKLSLEKFLGVERRAKYILFKFSDSVLISHLGMTGQWGIHRGDFSQYQKLKHDHLALHFSTDLHLVYNDPRRFGFVDVVKNNDLQSFFTDYGVEPLDPHVDWAMEYDKMSELSAPVKAVLMNQKWIVGVGNIYACEALFRAQIHPERPMNQVKRAEFLSLIKHVRTILQHAIDHGGSTIRDYRNANNESGQYQDFHSVYNRENEVCRGCGKQKIIRIRQAGRSSFFCSACQR